MVISTIITWLLPLPISGLVFYAHSLLFNGFWFYFLLPFNIFLNLVLYLVNRTIIAYLIVLITGYPEEGEYKFPSKDAEKWLASGRLNDEFSYISKIFNISPQCMIWFIRRAFKAKIGRLRLFGFGVVSDPHLTEIGEGSIIGHNSLITGHMIEGDKIILKKVKIGKNCTIGACAIVCPGAVIGDNTVVGAHSFVPKNAKLDKNSVYAGTPVRKLKSLKNEKL